VNSLKIATKILKLKQVEEKDNYVSITGFRVEDEKWDVKEVSSEESREKVINKLLEVAGEYMVHEKTSDSLVLIEVETLGQKVVIGEGGDLNASTVLIPKPQYLRRILFVKCTEPTNCRVVYEYKPSSQFIVYEGNLSINNIDYDFIVLEGNEYTRIIYPHELLLPKPKPKIEEKKKKKRRKKSKNQRQSQRVKREKPGKRRIVSRWFNAHSHKGLKRRHS